jgi:hypothetical protein
LKGWTLHIAAGETAVVVPRRQAGPSLVSLARDIRLGRFPLGIQAVELLLETLVGGLARVDGAAGVSTEHIEILLSKLADGHPGEPLDFLICGCFHPKPPWFTFHPSRAVLPQRNLGALTCE